MKKREAVGPHDKKFQELVRNIIKNLPNSALAFSLLQKTHSVIILGHCAVCDDCKKKLAKIYEHACETGEFLWETEDKER